MSLSFLSGEKNSTLWSMHELVVARHWSGSEATDFVTELVDLVESICDLVTELVTELELLNLKWLLFTYVADFKSQVVVSRTRKRGSAVHAHGEVKWLTRDPWLQENQGRKGAVGAVAFEEEKDEARSVGGGCLDNCVSGGDGEELLR